MSDTHKHGNIPLDSREKIVPTSAERQENGFAELKAHLADFKRRALEVTNLDELLDSNDESVD